MRLIHQSFEILEQKDFSLNGIKRFIELCGRVCYKSEDKITETSHEAFVDNLIERGHDRPLEFGTVHLRMLQHKFKTFRRALVERRLWNDMWIRYSDNDPFFVYATLNYRYYLDLCACGVCAMYGISRYFTEEYGKEYPPRYTVRFITDRGTMDEFRTHVGLSHLAESTRYCNYSQKRFGGDITYIVPNYASERSKTNVVFANAISNAEKAYFSLLHEGWKPQQARCVLPLSIKSELISCGFLEQWRNFFYRRDAKDAHPMAQELAHMVKEEFIKRGYIKVYNVYENHNQG